MKRNIEQFSREKDFDLWRLNIKVILIQQKCVKALKDEELRTACLTQAKNTEMMDKGRSLIIPCLVNKALREVSREKKGEECDGDVGQT